MPAFLKLCASSRILCSRVAIFLELAMAENKVDGDISLMFFQNYLSLIMAKLEFQVIAFLLMQIIKSVYKRFNCTRFCYILLFILIKRKKSSDPSWESSRVEDSRTIS